MIFDTIENNRIYTKLSPRISKAMKIAAETDFEKLADGKYEVDGDNLFYIVQRYKTGPVKDKVETHQKYIDLQFIAKGVETIGYAHAEGLKEAIAYDESREVGFFHAENDVTFLNMKAGSFTIFWPNDAHMPGCQTNKPGDVTKVVFKIKV